MEDIIDKLSGVLSPEDLEALKTSINEKVESKSRLALEEASKDLEAKATEFCETRIKAELDEKTKQLDTLSSEYCKEYCEKVQVSADEAIKEQVKAIEEEAENFCKETIESLIEEKTAEIEKINEAYCAEFREKCKLENEEYKKQIMVEAEQYCDDVLEENFKIKYGEELNAIEESVLTTLDKYLKYDISEKISPSIIKQAAITETYAPIIAGIKSLFEETYIPLDTTGSNVLSKLKKEKADLERTLTKQINENLELNSVIDKTAKESLITEKTAHLTESQKTKVRNFFGDKKYDSVRKDIGNYVEMIEEQVEMFKKPTSMVNEKRSNRFNHRNEIASQKDNAGEYIRESFRKDTSNTDGKDFLLTQSSRLSKL
jgi:hypothetical protein